LEISETNNKKENKEIKAENLTQENKPEGTFKHGKYFFSIFTKICL